MGKKKKEFKLDFLCVGFAKCGTTTLDSALRKNEYIYLPENAKEVFYLNWKNDKKNTMKMCQELYYPDYYKTNRVVGDIEPSYYTKAKDVYETYGHDVKIIFMLREPTSALFSLYKMSLRSVRNKDLWKYYLKNNNDIVKIFDYYIKDYKAGKTHNIYNYDEKINEYLKYYKKNQICFVVMEELVKNSEKEMNRIQKFLNVKPIKYESLSKSNASSKVSRNALCTYINYWFTRMIQKSLNKKHFKLRRKIRDLHRKLQKYTFVENNEIMTKKQEKELKKYFKASIENTSKIIGKDLNKIWYDKKEI